MTDLKVRISWGVVVFIRVYGHEDLSGRETQRKLVRKGKRVKEQLEKQE